MSDLALALYGSPVAIIGNVILVTCVGVFVYMWRAHKEAPDVGYFVSMLWLAHLIFYYLIAFWLRTLGGNIDDPVLRQVITLWSSSIRLHIILSTLFLAIYHRRRERREH